MTTNFCMLIFPAIIVFMNQSWAGNLNTQVQTHNQNLKGLQMNGISLCSTKVFFPLNFFMGHFSICLSWHWDCWLVLAQFPPLPCSDGLVRMNVSLVVFLQQVLISLFLHSYILLILLLLVTHHDS